MRLLNVRVHSNKLEDSIKFYEALGFELATREGGVGIDAPNPFEINSKSEAASLFGVTGGATLRIADLRFPGRGRGTHLQLVESSGAAKGEAASSAPVLSVDSRTHLDTALSNVEKAGGRVETSPTALSRVSGVKVATVRDPGGNLIQLVEPRAEVLELRRAARDFRQKDTPAESLAARRQAVAVEEW